MIGAVSSKQLPVPRFETAVSKYERYLSVLISSLVLVGLAVMLLLLIWLTTVEWGTNKETVAAPKLSGQPSPEGIAEDFDEPSAAELTDLQEPQLIDELKSISNDPSTLQAVFARVRGNIAGLNLGNQGDQRTAGDGPDDGEGPEKHLSDADRWDIRYTTASRDEYAQQLDYFKIELGALSVSTEHIAYVLNFSAEKPTASSGDRGSERAKKRIYFRYPAKSASKLKQWDMEFLKSAGITKSDRVFVQFYPNETRQMLLALEQKELGDKSLESVRKTTFGVRATTTGFEYYVMDIKYR